MSKATFRNLIIALILIAVTGAALGYMIYQVFSQGTLLEEQINALESQNTQEASLLKLQRIFDETTTDREKLQNYFFLQESDSIYFLNEVDALIPKVGLSGKTIALQEVTDAQGSNWVEATFEVTGTRQDVQNFIQILEIAPYVSQLTNVKMRAGSGGGWQADITIQVQALSYDS